MLDEEKEEKSSNRSSDDESGNGSFSEQLASIQRDSLQSIQAHQKREMSVANDDNEAFWTKKRILSISVDCITVFLC